MVYEQVSLDQNHPQIVSGQPPARRFKRGHGVVQAGPRMCGQKPWRKSIAIPDLPVYRPVKLMEAVSLESVNAGSPIIPRHRAGDPRQSSPAERADEPWQQRAHPRCSTGLEKAFPGIRLAEILPGAWSCPPGCSSTSPSDRPAEEEQRFRMLITGAAHILVGLADDGFGFIHQR